MNNFDDPTAAPAWTWRGAPAKGVPLPPDQRPPPAQQSYEDWFPIAVERIGGPIMLISGAADTGLAGTSAVRGCRAAMDRLDRFGFAYRHQHLSYRDAGHDIAGPPPYAGAAVGGGTPAGNDAAIADSWPRAIAFLRDITLHS